MKKIEGSGVPESTMVGWLRKHGTEYVAEKIRIYQAKGALANPGGFLSAAMKYDWKESQASPAPIATKREPDTAYPAPASGADRALRCLLKTRKFISIHVRNKRLANYLLKQLIAECR